jgi:hypothetical protein
MKKIAFIFVAFVALVIFAACGVTTENEGDTIVEGDTIIVQGGGQDTPKVIFSLNADSPEGNLPPGERELLTFVADANTTCEIYNVYISMVSNQYYFVAPLWLEDDSGNALTAEVWGYNEFKLTTTFSLSKGTSKLHLVGMVTAGELPSPYESAYTFYPVVEKVEGNCKTEGTAILGKELHPKYEGTATVYASLNANSPSGTLVSGQGRTLLIFNLITDAGSLMVDNIYFRTPASAFSGTIDNCTLKDANGNVLNDYYFGYKNDVDGYYYLQLQKISDDMAGMAIVSWDAVTKLTLNCDVYASTGDALQIELFGFWWVPNEGGYYYNFSPDTPPLVLGNALIAQ